MIKKTVGAIFLAVSFLLVINFAQEGVTDSARNGAILAHVSKVAVYAKVLSIELANPDYNSSIPQVLKAEFEVIRVCEGEVRSETITVSFFPDDEMSELKIGTEVCAVLSPYDGTNGEDSVLSDSTPKEEFFSTEFLIENCRCGTK